MRYMKFKIKHNKFNILKIIAKFGKIFLFVFPLFTNEIFGQPNKEAINFHKFLPKTDCFTVFFTQKGVFQGEVENYKGILKRISKNRWRIVYFTNPPFEVDAKGHWVTLGYKGEEKQTLNLREYPNPILEVLFHLNHLEELFEIRPLKGNRYMLIPKGGLSQYVEKAILEIDKSGKPKRIEVFGGEDNYLIIDISKIEPACGGDKIGKP